MRWLLIVPLVVMPTIATAEAIQPGRWDVRSTIVELTVPGVPGFLQKMARGRSSAEHKVLTSGQSVEALLAPDPKARCVVNGQQVANGRYTQALTCPQKRGGPAHIVRRGSYDASGFVGQATVAGMAPKGALRIVLDQRATRVGD